MAGGRAAASLSLTIGVALATLVVIGGILAGPSIVDCSRQPDGIGACLRGKIQQSRLVSHTPKSARPAVSAEIAPDPDPAPSVAAETGPRNPGWIEANATEYEQGPSGVAVLSGTAGSVLAGGSTSAPAVAGDIALAPPSGQLGAGGVVPPTGVTANEAALSAPVGDISANGRAVPAVAWRDAGVDLAEPSGLVDAGGASQQSITHSGDVALAEAPGTLIAGGTATAVAEPADSALLAPSGAIDAGGRDGGPSALAAEIDPQVPARGVAVVAGDVGLGASGAGSVLLQASAVPPMVLDVSTPVFVPNTPDPPPVVTKPVAKLKPAPVERKAAEVQEPAPVVPKPVAKPKSAPGPVIKYNPRYPNVIVLPPPNTGANSSFATLTLN